MANIGLILVLYNPNWKVTSVVIEQIKNQVDYICIVDNSLKSSIPKSIISEKKIHYIPLNTNKGIACAQNIGIEYLLNKRVEYIVFSDQDSLAPSGLIHRLIKGYNLLNENNIKVGIVGTRAINTQTGKKYPPKAKELGIPPELVSSTSLYPITECYSVRSSISLIPANVIKDIGGFDESLFIDGVDHEWCWRAWHKQNYRSFIIEEAVINHKLGEGDRKIFNKSIAIPSPFRVFYQYRNFFILKKRYYTPKEWIKKNSKKYFIKAFYYPIFIKPRIAYLKNIFQGVRSGLNNKTSNGYYPIFK